MLILASRKIYSLVQKIFHWHFGSRQNRTIKKELLSATRIGIVEVMKDSILEI